jgi:predicted enzyme related to lactoylglutathione lyase
MINDIAFVAYSVRDLAKAVAFYRDVLGLQAGEPFGDRYAEFNVGSGVFALDADPPGYEPGTCTGVNFEVDDIAAFREKLFRNRVEVSDIYDFPTCRVSFAKDPDGNRFALHQRKQRT